jgi:hypothetical protein
VIEISARRTLPVPPTAAFAFLSQPHNHHRLVTRRIQLVKLDVTGAGELRGGFMVLRGPLGLHRPARTLLSSMLKPRELAGTAHVGSGTEVGVHWELTAAGEHATVAVLSTSVRRLAVIDRLLLAVGGRVWVRSLFAATLERLVAELSTAGYAAREGFDRAGVVSCRSSSALILAGADGRGVAAPRLAVGQRRSPES